MKLRRWRSERFGVRLEDLLGLDQLRSLEHLLDMPLKDVVGRCKSDAFWRFFATRKGLIRVWRYRDRGSGRCGTAKAVTFAFRLSVQSFFFLGGRRNGRRGLAARGGHFLR